LTPIHPCEGLENGNAYYQFPSEKYLTGLVSQVPEDFLFTFKVTDHITIKKYPNLARFSPKAGQKN
jgi:uncharacterized protein YecE (DUF72 family)